MRFGPRFDITCANITSINGEVLQWVTCCRYLGVYFVSGRVFKCSFHNAKSCFFRAFNSILGKVGRYASEEVILSLLRSKCLPCLLYGVEACPFYMRDKHSFEFTLTRTLMKLFRTSSIAVIRECQKHFNILPLQYQIDIRTASFLEQYITSTNSVCLLFKNCTTLRLHEIYKGHGINIKSVCDLRIAVYKQFANT